MKRESIAAVALALLAVVALGVAGATLDTAVSTGGDAGFAGGGDGFVGDGESDSDSFGSGAAPANQSAGSPVCIEELREPPALLVLFGFFALLGGLAYRETGSAAATLVVVGTAMIPIGGLWGILSMCGAISFEDETDESTENESIFSDVGEGGSPGVGEGEVASTPEVAFLIVVVAALVVSLLLLLAARGDDDAAAPGTPAAEADGDDEDPDLAAVGRTAGVAADRLEDADADNEVYRAWREMTEVLDVARPASSTPREFAEAATEAGVDPDAVDDLTDVFERVRYGGAVATGEREAAAAAALRRIETAHGDGGDE